LIFEAWQSVLFTYKTTPCLEPTVTPSASRGQDQNIPLQGCLLGAFDAPHPWYGKGETHQVEITETII